MNKITLRLAIENLILWLVPLIILSVVADVFSKAAFNELVALGGGTKITSKPILSLLSSGFSVGDLLLIFQYFHQVPLILINVVIGIWLHIQVKKASGRKWLWLIGGLFLSYWALGLYLFSLVLSPQESVADNSTSHNV